MLPSEGDPVTPIGVTLSGEAALVQPSPYLIVWTITGRTGPVPQ